MSSINLSEYSASLREFSFKVEDWADDVTGEQKEIISAGTSGSGSLEASLKNKVKSAQAIPEKISFLFERYGVFLQLGVSKGYVINPKGSGTVEKTGPGEFVRKPVEWFSRPLANELDNLTTIVGDQYAELAALGVALKIESLNQSIRIKGL